MTYHFTDSEPFEITYYRLKQLDRAADRHDRKFEYSRIILVKQEVEKLSIFLNPAQSHVTISGVKREE